MWSPATSRLPAGLDDAGNVALERELADLAAPQPELAERATRAPRDAAAIAQPRRVGVARQLLQLQPGRVTLLVGTLGVVGHRLQLGKLLGVLGDQLLALVFTLLEGEFRHWCNPLVLEREAKGAQQRPALVVVLGAGRDADVQPADRVDLVVLDLRKDDLFLDADVVVAAAV